MCCAKDAAKEVALLPGLEHVRVYVDWEQGTRTLQLAAAALAEAHGSPAAAAGALPPPPPPLVLTSAQLKPGRVFVVANLQGAYYTLLELLSRHKFDFRTDNLLHTGNLVAPPQQPQQPQQPPQQPQQQQQQQPVAACAPGRRGASSAAVLQLARRHGAKGPMGAHECLALLAAERGHRARLEEERALLRAHGAAAAAPTAAPAGAASALSAQLAAAKRAPAGGLSQSLASAPAPASAAAAVGAASSAAASPMRPMRRATRRAPHSDSGSEDSGSESSSSSSDEDEEEAGAGEELVQPPATPCRSEGSGPGAGGCAAAAGGYDTLALAALMSMPHAVVLEPYGVMLTHVGPPTANGAAPARFHTLFSHRRPGAAAAAASAGAGAAASATGLALARDVVRCAVLPPLRTLAGRSPGWAAAVAAGRAPSREELLLELVEEPLSDLDAPPQQQQLQQLQQAVSQQGSQQAVSQQGSQQQQQQQQQALQSRAAGGPDGEVHEPRRRVGVPVAIARRL